MMKSNTLGSSGQTVLQLAMLHLLVAHYPPKFQLGLFINQSVQGTNVRFYPTTFPCPRSPRGNLQTFLPVDFRVLAILSLYINAHAQTD